MNAYYMPNVHGIVIYNPPFSSKEIEAFGTDRTRPAFCLLLTTSCFLSWCVENFSVSVCEDIGRMGVVERVLNCKSDSNPPFPSALPPTLPFSL